jgi:hypothetical protein
VTGDYKPILPRLAEAKVDRVNLEFAYPGTGDVSDLNKVPHGNTEKETRSILRLPNVAFTKLKPPFHSSRSLCLTTWQIIIDCHLFPFCAPSPATGFSLPGRVTKGTIRNQLFVLRMLTRCPTLMMPSLALHPASDPLDRHQCRRDQTIPTLSVLCGAVGLGMGRWRAWVTRRGLPVVTTSTIDPPALINAWIQSLCSTRDLLADATAWLSQTLGQNADELRRHRDVMTGRDFEWFWTNLLIPSDRNNSATVCRIILDVGGNFTPAGRIAERLKGSTTDGRMPGVMQIMIGLAGIVPRGAWPTLLLVPPDPGRATIWLVGAAHSLEQLLAAVPALPAAIAVEVSAIQAALRAGSQPHALAILREGIVSVKSLDEAELADRLQAVGITAGSAASARRVAGDGVSVAGSGRKGCRGAARLLCNAAGRPVAALLAPVWTSTRSRSPTRCSPTR